MGYFHCRPVDPGRDFVLLKPLIGFESSAGMGGEKADKEGEGNDEKEEGLANYQCFSKQISWYFCKTCGVRCFAYGGPDDGVVQDLDLETWSLQEQTYPSQDTASTDTANTQDQTKNTKTRVWHPLTGTWTTPEGRTKQSVYLSVNATTIEPDQPGFDLKEWHEKGWIVYGDWKNFNKEGGAEVGRRFGTPWNSGCY